MDFKVLGLALFTLSFLYSLAMQYLDRRSSKNPVPENVRDVYDAEKYKRWLSYHGENCTLDLVDSVANFVIYFALIAFDVLPKVAFSKGPYLATVEILLFVLTVDALAGAVRSYVSGMVIDEKYGFNKRTAGTFALDQIKSYVISTALMVGLVCAFAAIYRALGDWTLLLFTGIVGVILAVFSALYPFFSPPDARRKRSVQIAPKQ